MDIFLSLSWLICHLGAIRIYISSKKVLSVKVGERYFGHLSLVKEWRFSRHFTSFSWQGWLFLYRKRILKQEIIKERVIDRKPFLDDVFKGVVGYVNNNGLVFELIRPQIHLWHCRTRWERTKSLLLNSFFLSHY
jgi:hypothetical protein